MSKSIVTAMERLHDEAERGDPFDSARFEASLLLVRGAVGRLAWGTMPYQCASCGFEWEIWLSLGVEGPTTLQPDGLYVAAPFMVRCSAWPNMQACDGRMQHVRWNNDVDFGSPVLIPDDAPRFVLPYSASRGDTGARLEVPDDALVRARRALNEGGTS